MKPRLLKMKDLTKRFINVHSGLGPLGPSLQPTGLEGAKLGGETSAQLQLAQLYGQYGYTGLQGQGVALQPLQPQYLVQGIQGVEAGGQGVSHQQQQGWKRREISTESCLIYSTFLADIFVLRF